MGGVLTWLRNVALIIIVSGVVSLLWLWATSPLT